MVDVGDIHSTSVHLHVSRAGDESPYIALSHRWGVGIPLTLRRENINNFRRSIGDGELPRTFKDAVNITRQLKVRYLWIDSLCIIQNDPEDWEREAKLMEDVFSSAYCTIAASCARSTEDGFLKTRRDRQCVETQVGKDPPLYICELIDDFRNDVEQEKLNKRGWVLQERVLSRRTIYFAKNQVYWECGHGVRCETLTKMVKCVNLGTCNS